MPNALQVRTPPDALKAARTLWDEPWLGSLRSVARHEGRGMVIPASHSLTAGQRSEMMAAVSSLTSLLSAPPASEDDVAAEVYRLFAGFPSRAGEAETSVELRAEAYMDGLEGVPLWAIRDARKRVMRGEVKGSVTFAPSPPEFAQVARWVVAKTTSLHRTLVALLGAEIEAPEPDDAERARMADRMARLQQSLRQVG